MHIACAVIQTSSVAAASERGNGLNAVGRERIQCDSNRVLILLRRGHFVKLSLLILLIRHVASRFAPRYSSPMKPRSLMLTAVIALTCAPVQASPITGRVTDSASSNAVAGARVTLFTPDLRFFREARNSVDGTFAFAAVGLGAYRLGVAVLGYE